MTISETTKEAWRANERVNKLLLGHLTPDMLDAPTPGGGYSVAQQLAHITEVKKSWGVMLDKAQLSSLPNLYDEAHWPDFIVETDLAQIEEVMERTSERILEASENANDKGTLPHTSVEAYLIHMMLHDAHHRGQILLALKTSGHPLPAEDEFWQPLNNEQA